MRLTLVFVAFAVAASALAQTPPTPVEPPPAVTQPPTPVEKTPAVGVPPPPPADPVPAAKPPPPPAAETLAQSQLAFDAGKRAGIGVPLIGWGSTYIALGLVFGGLTAGLSASGGGDAGALILGLFVGIGAAQVIPGAILVTSGGRQKPQSDFRALQAYDAGYDVGWGNTMIGYGVVWGVSAIVNGVVGSAASYYSNSSNVGGVIVAAALAGTHLGFGISSRIGGQNDWERQKASLAPGTTMFMVPAVQF